MKPRRNLFLGSFLIAFSMAQAQAQAGVQYWDADGDTSSATGGSGIWTTVNTWRALTSTGTLGSWVGYDDAVFGGTAGTVTLSGTVQANSLQFDTTGYSITGGTIQLGNPAAPGLYVVTGGSASISSAFTNSGAGNAIHIGKAGYAGTLTLTNFSGLTANNRALAIDYGNLYLSTATTALSGTSGGVSIASGATLTYDNSGTVNWGSATTNLTGTGTLVKKGAGNLIFGLSTGTAKVNVNLSTGAVIDLQVGSIESSSAYNGVWTNNYADLNVASGATFNLKENQVYIGALTGAGTVQQSYTCTGPSLTIGRGDRSGAFSGVIKDNVYVASVEKVGSGTQTLSGANTFTGKTLISGGKIALGNALALQNSAYDTTGSTGAIGLDVTGYTTPTLGGLMGSVNLATAITGYGSVTNLTLNPQTGVSNAYGGIIANGASGGMTLTKTGAGTQVLSGPNTYSGGTTLTTGALQIGVANVGSVGSITSSAIGKGTLTFNGGTLSSDSTTARTILNAVTFTGNAVLGDATKNGKLTFAAGLDLGAVTRTITLNSDVQLDGAFSNPGANSAVIKDGTGTLTINVSNAGVNFGTGNPSGFQIKAGKVVATNTAAFGSAGQIVTLNGGTGTTAGSTVEFATDSSPNAYVLNQNSGNNGTVILNRATSGTAITYSMGTATLGAGNIINVQKGANVTDTPTLTLSGLTMTAGYAGITTLSPTTANISITGAVNSNSNYAKTLQLDGTSTGNIISGTITNGSNVVTLTKANSGTWTLSGVNNAYTGPTNISGGTLKAGSSTAFNNTSGLAMTSTGTFDLNGFNAAFTTFSGVAGNIITNSSSATGASNATTAGTPSGAGIYVDALRLSTAGQTIASQITDGATRDTQIIINNVNSSANLAGITNTTNSFSGGLVLANNASGTRLRISSAITGTPFGSGPIIIGQAATDKAGILLDTVNSITLANNIVFNTALGTDVPGIRLDTTNHVFSGKITANLANAKFSNGGSASLTGQITGASGLEIDGPTITLNNVGTANDYLGTTTITTGTLKLGTANQIPNGSGKGNVSLASTLDLNGYSETINGLTGAGIVDNLVASGGSANTLTLGDGNATGNSFTGIIKNTAGTLSVVKIGTGSQTLGGANIFTGGLTIKNGTVVASTVNTALGGATGTGSVTLGDTTGSNAATLLVNTTGLTYANPIVLATNATVGTLTLGNTGTAISTIFSGGVTGINNFTINSNATTGTITFSTAAINNAGTVTNTGAGTGTTTISGGIGSNVTGINQNSTTSALTLATTALTVNSGGTTLTNTAGTKLLTVSGGIIGTGNLILDNDSATASGITINTTAINNAGNVTNSGGGNGSTSIAIGFGSNVTDVIQNSTTSTLSIANGVASTNTGSTYIKAGTLQLNGPGGSTAITPLSSGTIYLGDTSGSSAATLALGNTNVLANPIVVQSNSNASTKAIHVNTSGVPVYSGGITLNDNLDITTASTSGLTIQTGDVTINNNSVLSFKPSGSNAGTFTVSSKITGTGGSVVFGGTTSGSPIYVLSGANDYTGGTTISKGTAKIGNATALGGNSGMVSVASGAVLDLNGTAMTGTNALTLNGTGISSAGALINSSSTAGTYAGLLALGSASRIIAGTGDITLSNIGTITGTGFGLTVGGAKNTSIASVIGTGAGTLTKQDAGTLTLSGANTYTGTTTIGAGTLNAGIADGVGSGALGNGGDITFSGGTLQYSAASAGTDYAARFKNSTTAAIKLNMNAQTVNLAGVIDSSNTQGLSISGGGLLTFSGSSANAYTGTTTLNNASTVTLSKTGAGLNAAVGGDISIALGGTLALGASNQIPDSANVTLAAIAGGTYAYWNLMGYSETIGGLAANSLGNAIIQNNSGSAGTSTLTIKNSADYSYTGYMRDTNGGASSTIQLALVKDGAGKQTLAGANVAYTGATTIKAGTLELLSSATAFASEVGFDTGSTGTLQINGATGKIGGLSSVDSTNNNAFVQNAVGTDAVLTVNQAGNSSFGGIIRDNTGGNKIGITKTGAGILTLSGANTFTGGVTLNGTTNGGIRITNSSGLGGDGVATKTVNFYQGTNGVAELDMDPGLAGSIILSDKINFTISSNSTTGSGIVSRTGTNEIQGKITMQGGLASTAISSSAGSTLTLSGVVSANASGRTLHLGGASTNDNTISGNMDNSGGFGDFSLQKNNAGTWILSGTNSYTGTTTITAGLLKASGGSAIPDAGLVSLADVAGATFQVVGSEAIGALSGGGTTGGTVSIDASQTLTLASGTQTFAGKITGSGALRLNASAVSQTLTGDNDYDGSTSINYGVLNIQHANALGGTTNGTTVSSGATLQLQGGKNFATETLTIAGQGVSNSGVLRSISGNNIWNGDITVGSAAITRVAADADTLTLAGNVTLSTTAGDQFVLQGAGNIDVTGQITGASRVTSSATGAGIRTLSNASNDYAGDTGVNGGFLQAGVTNALPYGTGKGNLVLNGGSSAVGVFNLNGYDVATNGLAGTSGTFVGNVVNNANGTTKTLTIGYNDATASFAGILADNNNSGTGVLAISKTGTGVQTLTGTSTYTGATNVTAGTLVINGNISTSTTTVQIGGTLAGSGTTGSVTINNGGTLAPGTSPGTLTVSGNLGLNDSSILAFEFDPFDTTVGSNINDLVSGISNFTLDGLLNVTATSGSFGGVTSGSWRLFNYSGTLTNNILTLNSMPTLASGYSWSLDTATAGQVNLSVIPEPRAALLGGLGVLALLRRRRG